MISSISISCLHGDNSHNSFFVFFTPLLTLVAKNSLGDKTTKINCDNLFPSHLFEPLLFSIKAIKIFLIIPELQDSISLIRSLPLYISGYFCSIYFNKNEGMVTIISITVPIWDVMSLIALCNETQSYSLGLVNNPLINSSKLVLPEKYFWSSLIISLLYALLKVIIIFCLF